MPMKLEKRLSNEEIKARLVFVVAVTLSFVLVNKFQKSAGLPDLAKSAQKMLAALAPKNALPK